MKSFTDVKVIVALIVVAIAFFFIGSQYRLQQIRQAFVKSFSEFTAGLGTGEINTGATTTGFNQ